MSRIKSLLFLLVLGVQVPLASATVTYAVGTCKPKLPSFTTIQGALNAAPSPNVVEVCPGTYNEQIVIGYSVTLEGVSFGDSAGATIAVPLPSGALNVSVTDDFGTPVAAQIFVAGGGEVNLTNLNVDGSGGYPAGGAGYVAGVFYLGSSGTLNQLTVQLQDVGVQLEGGIPVPSVTLENSTVEAFDYVGVFVETNSSLSELSATIKGNSFLVPPGYYDLSVTGIDLYSGATASITDNLYSGACGYYYYGTGICEDTGIYLYAGSEAVVSKNTVNSAYYAIYAFADNVSVSSNAIYAAVFGIGGSSVTPITGNTVVQSVEAIGLECGSGNTDVRSNRILNATWGLVNAPPAAVKANSYMNVGTISADSCSAGSGVPTARRLQPIPITTWAR